MKSKTLLLAAALIGFANFAHSQNWFPDNAKWTYSWAQPGAIGFERLTVDPGVTVTNGMTCRTLHRHLQYNFYNPNTNAFDIPIQEELDGPEVCEMGDSVFYRNFQGDLKLQYDFSMQPGDTLLFIEPFAYCGFSMVVDSLGSLNLKGTDLRTQYVTVFAGGCTGVQPEQEMRQYLVIERIGLVQLTDDGYHPAYLIPQSVFNFVQDAETWSLRCFSSNELDYHLITGDCEALLLGTDDANGNDVALLRFFPNPAHDEVTLVNRTGSAIQSVRVFALNGALEMQISAPVSEILHIGNLHQGVHILCLETEQGVLRQLLVKQ